MRFFIHKNILLTQTSLAWPAGAAGCYKHGNVCAANSPGMPYSYPPSICCPDLARILVDRVCTSDTYESLLFAMETGTFPVPVNCIASLCEPITPDLSVATKRGGPEACKSFVSYSSTSGSLSIKLDATPGDTRKCSFMIMPNWFYTEDEMPPETEPSQPSPTPSGGGASDSDCSCGEDYWGIDCNSPCNIWDTCSGNGHCSENGTCICVEGYAGSDCSISGSADGNVIRPAMPPAIPRVSASVTFLDYNKHVICRGALVSRQWVLTTASCCDLTYVRGISEIRFANGEAAYAQR
jgi:hypothetical protein